MAGPGPTPVGRDPLLGSDDERLRPPLTPALRLGPTLAYAASSPTVVAPHRALARSFRVADATGLLPHCPTSHASDHSSVGCHHEAHVLAPTQVARTWLRAQEPGWRRRAPLGADEHGSEFVPAGVEREHRLDALPEANKRVSGDVELSKRVVIDPLACMGRQCGCALPRRWIFQSRTSGDGYSARRRRDCGASRLGRCIQATTRALGGPERLLTRL
jgi:hypothetical protein